MLNTRKWLFKWNIYIYAGTRLISSYPLPGSSGRTRKQRQIKRNFRPSEVCITNYRDEQNVFFIVGYWNDHYARSTGAKTILPPITISNQFILSYPKFHFTTCIVGSLVLIHFDLTFRRVNQFRPFREKKTTTLMIDSVRREIVGTVGEIEN